MSFMNKIWVTSTVLSKKVFSKKLINYISKHFRMRKLGGSIPDQVKTKTEQLTPVTFLVSIQH